MGNDVSTLEDPVKSARERLWEIAKFFLGFLRYAGLFVLGIIIGMGIILKDPLPSKSQQIKVTQLEKENNDLKSKLSKNLGEDKSKTDLIIKKSFVID